MIIDISRETLDLIKSSKFRSDAARYVESYEAFMASAAESGIELAAAPTGAELDEERFSGIEVQHGNFGKSFYYGRLSPACIDCRTGVRSKTVFHTLACNRDCFFCANKNQGEYDYFSRNVNDAEHELAQSDLGAGFTSIALTGGEPLLFPEKALSFFRTATKRYPEAHKRLYTNGDLLTDELAARLAEAGLNEIRISIKLNRKGYPAGTLKKLAIAKRHVPYVMVEMPVIPGTLEIMEKLLLQLDEAGIHGVNILEFLYPWGNASDYRAKGYQLKRRPYRVLYSYEYAGGLPIAGSEECCLELLKFAAKHKLKLNVHYCSLENKLTAQVYHQNAGVKLLPHEVMSDKDFFIKIARVYSPNIDKVTGYLEFADPGGYQATADYVEFHPRHISGLREVEEVALTYNIAERTDKCSQMREVKIDLIDPRAFDYDHDI